MYLYEIELDEGAVESFDVNYDSWNGSGRRKITVPPEYDGVHIIGKGRGKTIVQPGYDATFMFGTDVGHVKISGCTLLTSRRYTIKIGESGEFNSKLTLDLHKVAFIEGQHRASWGISSTNADMHFIDVDVDLPGIREHFLYAHGVSKYGIYWKRVDIQGVAAEALKVCTRAFEAEFVAGAQLIVEQCQFRNWFTPSSQRGGVAIALQGCGLSGVWIKRTLFWGAPGSNTRSHCIGISDGLSTIRNAANNQQRYYDINGVPGGPGATCGTVDITDCGFMGYGTRNLVSTQTLFPGYEDELGIPYHPIVTSFRMKNCGAYGTAGINLKHVETAPVISGMNNPRTEVFLESVGFDTSVSSPVRFLTV